MKKKILVVDDHRMMLNLMTDLLEKGGHKVVTAQDGLSALNTLTSFLPDIMFVDLIMPRIGGEKLCRIIRRIPRLNDCYIVIVSGTAVEHEVDYTEMGANACIAKGPFDIMAEHVLTVIKDAESPHSDTRQKPIINLFDVHARRTTKELLYRNRHLETILDSMAEGLLETFSGTIVYANSAAVSLFGMSQEKLLGSYPPDLFDETVRSQMETLLKSGNGKPCEVGKDTLVDLKGRQVTITKLPMTGEPSTNIILITDVTKRKQFEEEKAKLEEQLEHSRKMEAIGQLAGGVAHDFNNVLMGIQGHASLALLHADSGRPHSEHFKGIEDMVQTGADLTKQLLGFAMGGKYDVKPTDPNEVIEKSSEMFGRTKKEIRIHRKLQKDIWPVEVDRGQIEQVLLNFYVNAWHAMPHGGDLYIETSSVVLDENYAQPFGVKSGNYVKMSVTDTGVGIDEATLQRIFEPFFTTKEMGRGTGLGLASAYGIIKNHGGVIDVYSEKGEGTTFNIYLQASEKEVTIKERKLADVILKGTETVLLVDDEDVIIDVGKDMLQEVGYKVLLARSGKEAVQVYGKHKDDIDIVILDMIMPNMGGGEVYDIMKEDNPKVKVLLSSGYSIRGEATEILERGCDGFIQKPFNMKELSGKIREILDKK
jgi:PAS domain S-box-containing protein